MSKTQPHKPIPPRKQGSITSYRPEDIKRYGVQRFLDEQAARGPFKIPPMHFTDAENKLMDELLEQERQVRANGL